MAEPLPQTTLGRRYGGLTPQQRTAQRYQQFLQAGLEVFGSTGFRTATVRSLCKQAKLTDRYFYETFGSLEKLLMATYKDCMGALKQDILKAISAEYFKSDAPHAICAGLDAFFKALENTRIARICMVELEGISVEVNTLYYAHIGNFAEMLVTLANHAFPNWKLDAEQQQIIGISLVGAMRQAATNWFISDYEMDRKVLVETTSQLFLGIIKMIETEE